jgi:hypothetical protein
MRKAHYPYIYVDGDEGPSVSVFETKEFQRAVLITLFVLTSVNSANAIDDKTCPTDKGGNQFNTDNNAGKTSHPDQGKQLINAKADKIVKTNACGSIKTVCGTAGAAGGVWGILALPPAGLAAVFLGIACGVVLSVCFNVRGELVNVVARHLEE